MGGSASAHRGWLCKQALARDVVAIAGDDNRPVIIMTLETFPKIGFFEPVSQCCAGRFDNY